MNGRIFCLKKQILEVVLTLSLILVVFSVNIYAQNEKPVADDEISVDTNLITVPVAVLDRDGRYITNLKKEDFQIFENGIEQEIAFFEPTEQPFTVLLLLDNSGGMGGYIPELVRVANAFVSQLRPDDRVIAATIGGEGKVYVLFESTKVSDLERGIKIKARTSGGPATTFDAVDYALRKMKKISGRKAIILFSDAGLNGVYATAEGNLDDAEESEASIYTIRFGSIPSNLPAYKKDSYLKWSERSNSYMRNLASKSGGRAFHVEDISNLEETFKMIAEELSRQYSLGYYPKEIKEGRKKIKVKMRQPNLVVRARESYVVKSPKK